MRHSSTVEGYIKKESRFNEEKENTGNRLNESATIVNVAIRHTMTNSSRKQQHCCCSINSGIASHRASAAAAAAALCTRCAYKTDFSVGQTTSS